MTTNGSASALTFAHLSGVSASRSKAKGDDDKDSRDDGQNRDDGDSRAQSDDDDPEAESDKPTGDDRKDDDDDTDKPRSSRRAKAGKGESDDDGDGDEDRRDDKARKAERARCGAILASPYAAHDFPLACRLAFATGMAARDAIAFMHDVRPAPNSAASRASRNPSIGPSAGDRPNQASATVDRMAARMRAAAGIKQ